MQSELEYFEMQEENATSEIIAACAKAIFEAHDAETMGQLQRTLYKYTDAGIAIAFRLHNGEMIYSGDKRAYEIKEPWNHIREIGASSIVEGNDAEVPLELIDLARYADDDKYEGDLPDLAQIAVKDFDAICDGVNDEACRLWDESHPDGMP